MDYSRIYIELMERSFDRVLDCYCERHHIIPKCMGGDNKPRNIVSLTPEEHYLAHQLLVKIYPSNEKLVYACQAMSMSSEGHVRNNKMFGWLKRKMSDAKKENNGRLGTKHSDETKKKMSNNLMGNQYRLGKIHPHSDETKSKISQALTGRKLTEEHKRKLSEAKLARRLSK